MKPHAKKWKKWRPSFAACALLAATQTPMWLTGCASASPNGAPPLNVWQPLCLTIEAGAAVPTTDGVYQAQTRETWHSDKRYRDLEDKYLDMLSSEK